MKTKKTFLVLIVIVNSLGGIMAQHLTQTIKGRVVDKESQTSLLGATITIPGTEPLKATISDAEGYFRLENVPVGRYTVSISYIGYQPIQIPEVLLSSGKEVDLKIELVESMEKLKELVVKASTKDGPMNAMALTSARSFSVEEASRYAGGFDDPARMASSFAGITTGNIQDNSIVIRGNAPKGLLWRLEGVAIPNPNHFAGAISAGGGFVSIFSGQLLSNSDFFTGAFPAEYGNALAGVFDMKFRTGNQEKREYWFQAGLMGIDVGSEGPFVKGKKASYLFNYRYSTFGLLSKLLPEGAGMPVYQDLSYKLNMPTRKAGIFSLWGTGASDNMFKKEENDSAKWVSVHSKEREETNMKPAAAGLTHKYLMGTKSYINTTLAVTNYSGGHSVHQLDENLVAHKIQNIDIKEQKIIAQSFINHKFNVRHTNRTGFVYTYMLYDIDLRASSLPGVPMTQYVNNNGSSYLWQAYSQSRYNLATNLTANLGVHFQYFGLNGNYSVEPRAGLRWNFMPKHAISLGFGKHSQLEDLKVYLAERNDDLPNKSLDFTNAYHIVLGYDWKLSDNARLKIEPYFQYLYDVPVIQDSSFSMVNFHQQWFLNDSLVNKGTGTNLGLDVTIEHFLQDGFYWLATASIFDSKYKGGDGISRNSAYNRRFVANLLCGKEFYFNHHSTKYRILSINGKLSYMGGEHLNPIMEPESLEAKEVIWDHTNAYERQADPAILGNLTVSYKINKAKYTSTWALQVLNIFGSPSSNDDFYNIQDNKLDVSQTSVIVPSISYKIEF